MWDAPSIFAAGRSKRMPISLRRRCCGRPPGTRSLLRKRPVGHIRRVLLTKPWKPAETDAPVTVAKPSLESSTATLIIPTRDRADLLAACLAGLEKTRPHDFDLVIFDNGSREPATRDLLDRTRVHPWAPVLDAAGTFNFSALCNRAAELSQGRVLVFLNNDTVAMQPDWLANLVSLAVRPDVGTVGAKLVYPSGRLQHDGLVLGLGGYAAHIDTGEGPAHRGYLERCSAEVREFDPLSWRRDHLAFLEGAERIVAPSDDVAARMSRYLPRSIVVWEPESDAGYPPEHTPRVCETEPLRIVTLGSLNVSKGLRVVQALADAAGQAGAPLRLSVLGAASEPLPQNVMVSGTFLSEDLGRLFTEAAPHAVFLPAIWPETWSFVLTAALKQGLPVIAFDIGASAARSRAPAANSAGNGYGQASGGAPRTARSTGCPVSDRRSPRTTSDLLLSAVRGSSGKTAAIARVLPGWARAICRQHGLTPGTVDLAHYAHSAGHLFSSWDAAAFHYLAVGSGRGWSPRVGFSPAGYRRHNPDVALAGYEPFAHWLRFGRREGRDPAFAADPPIPDIRHLLGRRRPDTAQALVDIVMPVYGGRALALQAIDSVRGAATREAFQLVVVDGPRQIRCCGVNCMRWPKPA